MDSQLIRRLSDAFAPLSAPYTLFDGKGKLLLGSVRQTVQPPLGLAFMQPTLSQGAMFVNVDAGDGFLVMTPPSPAAAENLLMAAALIKALWEARQTTGERERGFRQLLLGELSLSEAEAMIAENRFPREAPRCVMAMSIKAPVQPSAESTLKGILPLDTQDMLVPISRHSAALIKSVDGATQADELYEYAAAMRETALSEEGIALTIGIGDVVNMAAELSKSYRQAHTAMEIGCVFHPKDSVFLSRTMLLERFLYDIPPEIAAAYHQMLFNRKTARLFSDEMLETVNMFLSKDLNLSDTARQMYIHRNTLVYRLDKVQKQLGLDLRHFADAMTFKLLFEMKKCAELHPDILPRERK